MPTSRSVAMMTTASRVASTLTFVSTGLGDRDGTTADALCRAASNDSLGQQIFIVGKGSSGPVTGVRGGPLLYPKNHASKRVVLRPVRHERTRANGSILRLFNL